MIKQCLCIGALIIAAFTFTTPARAGIVGFEDVLLGTSTTVGGSFTSDGVSFTMQDYLWPGGTVYSGGHGDIINPWVGSNFGTGQVFHPNNINALIDLAGTVGQQTLVTIPFHDSGGNNNFLVNPSMGGAIINVGQFFDPAIDGATINGVSVSVTGTNQSGFITLTGPVDQVIIGGQETLIDNIRFSPEPTTALMLLSLTLAAANRRHTA